MNHSKADARILDAASRLFLAGGWPPEGFA
jgi:hypothetical protein